MPNRKARRAARFGQRPPATIPPADPLIPLSLKMEAKDYVSMCLAVAMWLIPLPASQQTGVFVTRFVLVGVFLVRPVLHLPWVAHAETPKRRRLTGSLNLLALAALVAVSMRLDWPPVHRHALSKAERAKFEKPLIGLKQPKMSVHLYCAPEDEVDCEYAADLVPLFGEAGWDISTTVDRVTLTLPKAGVLIGLHGTAKLEDESKLKWNQGEWTLSTPEEWAVRQAFVNIGIEPDSTSGAAVPENQINLYIGHEREDESAPTDMTRGFENLKRLRSQYPKIVDRLLGAK
jgi:hypothetical protein